MTDDVIRECRECHEIKALDEFYKTSHGHRHKCKKCVALRTSKWNQINKAERAVINRRYRQANPEVNRRSARNQRYKKTYGITAAEFDQKLIDQNSKCAICDREIQPGLHKYKAALDHCHKSGRVRDILCNQCNVGIGVFEENIDVITNAIQYLIRWQND